MLKIICLVVVLLAVKSFAQTKDTLKEVSLPAVIINAFEQSRTLKDVPASVNYLNRHMLDNFNTSSILSAVNTTPGVRLEERSPGSYRVNIRGSSLRSPFGVRNVKIYYNDIPFTDAGGDSYLNQLGNLNINSIEIIKGSNNSIYGAGTGGVMLIESLGENEKAGISGGYSAGSYGLQNYNGSVTTVSDNVTSSYRFQHQKSDGYREHSNLKKSIASWDGLFKTGRGSTLKTTFLLGDLFYETPGGLTKAEFDANPKAARPATTAAPGAIAANAFIKQKMFLSGATYNQAITPHLLNKTSVYGMYTQLINPNLRDYENTSDPGFGARTVFKYRQSFKKMIVNIDGGGEFQQDFASVHVHKNVNGAADSLISYDNISNQQSVFFLQTSLDSKGWTIITGASLNILQLNFQRFVSDFLGKQNRTFNNEIAPRFSLMKKFRTVNIYTSIAKGFSPPATDELLPTGGAINLALHAEEGTNYDVGVKGTLYKNIYVDVNVFSFSLHNTIVQRRDATGGTFFINAGKTKQHGIETLVSYPLFLSSAYFKRSMFWVSHTLHDFHYKQFVQLANDFSGKQLPSVPSNAVSSGIDLLMNNGISAGINYYYNDKIPLNDANSAYANSYHLIGAKIGFEKELKNGAGVKVFGGGDNLLNERYSLGNDINAFGGRYYNAAPLRNFYLSLIVNFNLKKEHI